MSSTLYTTPKGYRRSNYRRVPWSYGGHALGNAWMADSASASSASNPAAAVALRAAYHSAAAAASTTAAGPPREYAAGLPTTARSSPYRRRRHRDTPGSRSTRPRRPPRVRGLDQFAGERRALFVGEAERLNEQLPRIHGRRLARGSVGDAGMPDCERRRSMPRRDPEIARSESSAWTSKRSAFRTCD